VPATPLPIMIGSKTADLIRSKTLALYVYGCVSYEDMFQKPRCTETCNIYDPRTGFFSFCARFNMLDECRTNYTD